MLCLCGCGTIIPEGRKYVLGHNARVSNPWSGRDWKHNKGKSMLKLDTNPAWRGEKASNIAKHTRVYRLWGKADRCDMNPNHIGRRYQWANIGHQYRLVRSEWIRVCSPCHKELDGYTGATISEEHKKKISDGLKLAYAEGRR